MIMWSGIEACASTVCANLPCLAPLVKGNRSLKSWIDEIQSTLTGLGSPFSRRSSSEKTFLKTKTTERLGLSPGMSYSETTIRGGTTGSNRDMDLELGQIKVETTVGAG